MANDVAKPTAAQEARTKALTQFKVQLDQRAPQLAMALPSHIPAERFQRVVLTAVQRNPDLLDCDRQSLFNACQQAAQDGLIPDGREGAIVKFQGAAQWMPMVFGIQKKARNSGELSGISSFVVLKGESFRRWVDEQGEHLIYEPGDERPHISAENARQHVRLVFAMARTKDGELFVEQMSVDEIERVRAVSRAKKDESPWAQWWGEMARKTAVRRLSKRLPMSSDLDDLIRRDDELYELDEKPAPRVLDMGSPAPQIAAPPPPSGDGEGGGGNAKADNGQTPAGGSSSAPPPSTPPANEADASSLEVDIANALIDCRTHPQADDVGKLFQKELIDATPEVRARALLLIENRKAQISKEHEDSFPGDR